MLQNQLVRWSCKMEIVFIHIL